MNENPLRRLATNNGVSTSELARRAGYTQPQLTAVLVGREALSVRLADKIAQALRTDFWPVLVANCLWRRHIHAKLTDNERGFIRAAEFSTGVNADRLYAATAAGFRFLEDALTPPPPPPEILLAGSKDEGAKERRERSLELNRQREASGPNPPPPPILLKKGDK